MKIFEVSGIISIGGIFLLIFMSPNNYDFNQNFEHYRQNIEGSDLTIEMIPIKGGKFFSGSPSTEVGHMRDEEPIHQVEVSDFWMSSMEVTWDLYELFLYRDIDDQKSATRGAVNLQVDGISAATMPYVNFNKPGHPVVNLTEYAASMFCKWLTAKTGYFYRLPTEAEWEYACRAGSDAAFSFGNDPEILDQHAWYEKNSNRTFHPGGQKEPNSWGLYDMHGNVAEWVIDGYQPDYYSTLSIETRNPVLFPKSLYPRVVKGGSWLDREGDLRSAARSFSSKEWKKRDPQFPKSLWWMTDATHVGFRVIRSKKVYTKSEMEAFWGNPIEEY